MVEQVGDMAAHQPSSRRALFQLCRSGSRHWCQRHCSLYPGKGCLL